MRTEARAEPEIEQQQAGQRQERDDARGQRCENPARAVLVGAREPALFDQQRVKNPASKKNVGMRKLWMKAKTMSKTNELFRSVGIGMVGGGSAR